MREVQERGAGEIVLNCMASDGVRSGYDIEQLRAVRAMCRVPLVASGGAGSAAHFGTCSSRRGVDAALAASVFHTGAIAIHESEARASRRRHRGAAMAVTLTSAEISKLDFATRRRAPAGHRSARRIGGRADARLHESRGAERDARAPAASCSSAAAGSGCGRKARPPATPSCWRTSAATATADTLLITAWPQGPVCHTGARTCFGDEPVTAAERLSFLAELERIVERRAAERPEGSYTARLLADGPRRLAQKVGEEGVEVALAAVAENDEKVVAESADLLFHLLVLLRGRGLSLADVVTELEARHAAKT